LAAATLRAASGLGPPNPCTDADRHRRGQALRTVPTRSLLSSVLNHTPGPLLSATERRPMTLNCRPREAGTGRRRRVPRLPADRDPHPAEPLHTGRLAADAARVVGDEGWRNPTDLPNCDEPALLLNLLREAKQKGPTT
jgi:hypothetical protein